MEQIYSIQTIATIEKIENYMNVHFTSFDTEAIYDMFQKIKNNVIERNEKANIHIDDVPQNNDEFMKLLSKLIPDVAFWFDREIVYDYWDFMEKAAEYLGMIEW